MNEIVFVNALRQTEMLAKSTDTSFDKKNMRLPIIVADYLKTYFYCEHSLEELAKRFYVSKNHLAFTFKKKFGVTPAQYLQNVRIEEAKLLLRNTTRSVSEIAAQTGFANASHFARIYKQITGHTPTEEIKLRE